MATREYEFINGPETSTLPEVGEPSSGTDLITLAYAESRYRRNVTGSPADPVEVTASGITPGDYLNEMIFVEGDGGAVNVSANPQIAAGDEIGQELTLVAAHSSNTVTLEDGDGLALNGPCVLGTSGPSSGHTALLKLFWNGTVWFEEYRRV